MTAGALDPALLDDVRARIASGGAEPSDAVRDAVRDSGLVLGSAALDALARTTRAELLGAGPLQHLLEEPEVTDVLVNGPDGVWLDRGRGLERIGMSLGTTADVRALAVRLAAIGGQRLDDAQPSVDARLPDGTRLHAVLAPLAPAGAAISLRVLRARAFSLDELVASGALPDDWAGLLRALVERRANIVVSGGTGSGKTTLLAALLSLAGEDERIVTVEEARELVPDHPHVVSLATRRANIEGAGGIDLAGLVRDALRMRPDRIVLGECRGAEVREVLLAMNTGHDGGLATLHANAVAVVPARLEALAALAGMPREAVAAQAAGALDVVLHLRRERGVRFLAEIGVVGRDERGELVVRPAAWWDGRGAVELDPPVWRELAGRFGPWCAS
ncbi:TadA family conjugal transfer-associated ATPase [Myceligenerans pegani]|uniref:TadA family conjugal transfer-associated ATPase n=1 Tax=Myceligenerans pegani TaxID=2776917 RepID=A0ABR9MZW4_9MICO|nr:TadA family conjugal transfer-associated ATPase [Myceligenerans sp. TRM 65318]MBE1876943.1 TadA family conjugal transfer-associated ATPase [Myceligenerans sp. TRM 65318]MBE3019214.1 TadA family conjugal transfer-associated ATPase [Myceligenerans sp. TRM 65318]